MSENNASNRARPRWQRKTAIVLVLSSIIIIIAYCVCLYIQSSFPSWLLTGRAKPYWLFSEDVPIDPHYIKLLQKSMPDSPATHAALMTRVAYDSNWPRCITHADFLINTRPTAAIGYVGKATALSNLDEKARAIDVCNAGLATTRDPQATAEILSTKGHVLLDRYIDDGISLSINEASECFSQADSLHPGLPMTEIGKARISLLHGRLDAVISSMETLIRESGSPRLTALAYYCLGDAHRQRGEEDRARTMFKRAFDSNPHTFVARW